MHVRHYCGEAGADNPLGSNVIVKKEGLITIAFTARFKIYSTADYIHIFMINKLM